MKLGKSKSSSAYLIADIALIVIGVILWWYLYQTSGPMDGRVDNTYWYHGVFHGFYAVPNWFVGLFSSEPRTIFQQGGGGWYQFWFIVGISGLMRISSRR
ncbi:MAG: hypothetical protein WAQ25_02435 [Candidatus Saccharimonas sp.]